MAHAIFQFLVKIPAAAACFHNAGHGYVFTPIVRPVADVSCRRKGIVPVQAGTADISGFYRRIGIQVRQVVRFFRSIGKRVPVFPGADERAFSGQGSASGSSDLSRKTGQNQVPAFVPAHDSPCCPAPIASNGAVRVRVVQAAVLHDSRDAAGIASSVNPVVASIHCIDFIVCQICFPHRSGNAAGASIPALVPHHNAFRPAVFHCRPAAAAIHPAGHAAGERFSRTGGSGHIAGNGDVIQHRIAGYAACQYPDPVHAADILCFYRQVLYGPAVYPAEQSQLISGFVFPQDAQPADPAAAAVECAGEGM